MLLPTANKLQRVLGAGTHIWPRQHDAMLFYGNPFNRHWANDNLVNVKPPYSIYGGNHVITTGIEIHRKCAASLEAVLQDVWARLGEDQKRIDANGVSQFDGSYVLRPIRGRKTLSMHAYGAAIDFDAKRNPLGSHHGIFTLEHPLVIAFEKQGWVWGGRWKTRPDPMHFQAARV